MATVPRLQRYYQGATTSCPHMAFGLLVSPAGSAGACRGSCPPSGAPVAVQAQATGRGLCWSRWHFPFQRPCPRARAGSPRFPGDPSRDSAPVHDPGRPVAPRHSRRFRCCPHMRYGEGVVDLSISRLTPPLRHLLSTLHDRRCRTPCKTRFRLAGCAFTGRESNPLDRDERFQFMASSSPELTLAQISFDHEGSGLDA